MSLISLVFGLGGAQTQIGAVTLDALLTEETNLNANVSRYAVETGEDPITDHITQDGETLMLSGVVTAAGVTLFGGGGRSKLMAAKEALRLIHASRLPVTIVTGMDVYVDMGMENARIGRAGALERITLDCEFRKIRKVESRTAAVPPQKAAADVKGKAGATATKGGKVSPPPVSATPGTDSLPESTLHGLINGKRPAPSITSGTIST